MTKRKSHRVLRAFIVVLCLLLVLSALVYDSNTRIVITEYGLGSAELPDGFDGFRIVQLSDLHEKEFGEGNEKLLAAVRKSAPDMIAVTGDIIDAEGQLGYVSSVITSLAEIAPVYYVTGNHEWAAGQARDIFGVMKECGAVSLRNEYVTLRRGGDSIVLAGIDDPNGLRDQKTLPEVMGEIRGSGYGGYVLLLAHRNDAETYEGQDIDLILCGHSHGGLIRLPFIDGLVGPNHNWFPKNTSGTYALSDGGVMLVSRGLGNAEHTLRLFNNPEIVVAVLKTE